MSGIEHAATELVSTVDTGSSDCRTHIRTASREMSVSMLVALLLLTGAASAADLRDVKDPAKIRSVFPHAAKIRVVNIWATWCVPCVAEMPELRAVGAAFGPEVVLVGVSMDDMIPGAKRENVSLFLDRQKIRYVNVYYRGNADDLSRYYRFEGEIPVTIAFDAKGRE